MANTDEQIAELDGQIGIVEAKLATLRLEMAAGNVTGTALSSLQGFISMAEGRQGGLRTYRAELERQRDAEKR